MGIGRAVRRIRRCGCAGSAAGETTGFSIWTSGSFFDRVSWELVLKAVAHHTDLRWVLLYVERWLKAPLQRQDGSLVERDRGTPQGSAISPLLANMMLHYAFDAWMARTFPAVQFERYCDDMIVHARSERQALQLRAMIASRLAECGLELNERKTRVVYCKDDDRRGSYEHTSFDFLSLHVPSAAVEEQVREALRELLSGGIGRGEDADAARDAQLECRSPLGQVPHGPGADVQPSAPGLVGVDGEAPCQPCG